MAVKVLKLIMVADEETADRISRLGAGRKPSADRCSVCGRKLWWCNIVGCGY